jgi:predicted DNA-binding ribbon-helix-helix protein
VSAPADDLRLEKHSLAIAGHRTSVTLERAFWRALRLIARDRGQSLSELAAEIDRARSEIEPSPNLSSAIRVFVLNARSDNGR